ncbi:hypothetical protein C5S29_07130 [ANME-1 cluster archaeon GoMg3.2]|nr:hypothetical protein [ANME-1 cluster archaeon GoMg3.2]
MKVGPSTVKRVLSYGLTYYEYLPIKWAGRPNGEGVSMSWREIIKQAKKRYKLGA